MGGGDDILNFLDHHGVKGQKWGVRKPRGDRSAFKPSSDAKKVGELRKKPVHALTNKQLKTANERINLEQNFTRMNPSKIAKGKKIAAETLATIGIGVAFYNIATSPAGKAAISAGRKAVGR